MIQTAPAYRPSKNLAFAHATVPGNVEAGNANAYLIFPSNSTYERTSTRKNPIWYALLADGIGHGAKERVASKLAVESVYKELINADITDEDEILYYLEAAFQQANAELRRNAAEDPSLSDMAASMVAGAIAQNRLYLAYVGDCCVYLVRNGVATLLTLDAPDSISSPADALQAAEENGGLGQEQTNLQPLLGAHELIEINSYLRDVEQLSAQAAGQRLSLVDYLNLREDDVVLFCSRALAAALSEEEIAHAIATYATDEVAEQLLSQMESRNADAKAAALLIEWKGVAAVTRRAPLRQVSRTPMYVTAAILFVGLIFVYLTFTFLRSNAEISTFSGIQALQESTAAPSVAQRGEMPASVAQPVAPAVANVDPTATVANDDDGVAPSDATASNVDNLSTVGASDEFTATATAEVAPTLAATATVEPPTRPPPTAEVTPTATDTATLTPMPTPTLANTPTTVAAALPSSTATAPSTATATPTTASTPTATSTLLPTVTSTATSIATFTATSTATRTAASTAALRPTATPTHTATATSTDAPTWTPLPTSTSRPTNTPIRGLAPTATVPTTPTGQPTATGSTDALGDNVQEIYILKKDDNLWTISFERGLTVEDLLAANPQIQERNQVLQPGMEIIIPKVTPSP